MFSGRTSAEKVLHAPRLTADYYTQCVEWASHSALAVALNDQFLLFDPHQPESFQSFLHRPEPSASTALSGEDADLDSSTLSSHSHASASGASLCITAIRADPLRLGFFIGDYEGRVTSLDLSDHGTLEIGRTFDTAASTAPVTCMDVFGTTLCVGNDNGSIVMYDIRQSAVAAVLPFSPSLTTGEGEGTRGAAAVCKWSSDGDLLAASGNDGSVFIWSHRMQRGPLCCVHRAKGATRAVAWHPTRRGILASGGGTLDGTVQISNTHNVARNACGFSEAQCASSMPCPTQITAIEWLGDDGAHLVTCHGFASNPSQAAAVTASPRPNDIVLWRSPPCQGLHERGSNVPHAEAEIKKCITLTGHTARPLFLSLDPSSQRTAFVTGSGEGDETLRFWRPLDSRCSDRKLAPLCDDFGMEELR